jgi:hypothetical protein
MTTTAINISKFVNLCTAACNYHSYHRLILSHSITYAMTYARLCVSNALSYCYLRALMSKSLSHRVPVPATSTLLCPGSHANDVTASPIASLHTSAAPLPPRRLLLLPLLLLLLPTVAVVENLTPSLILLLAVFVLLVAAVVKGIAGFTMLNCSGG